jgi:hypothetical protein
MRLGHKQPSGLTWVAAVGLLALVATGCRYSPEVVSGVQNCAAGNVCPTGLVCSPTNRCCAPSDDDPRCTGKTRKADAAPATTKVDPPAISFDAGTGPSTDTSIPRDGSLSADLGGDDASHGTSPSNQLKIKRLTTFPADFTTHFFDCSRAPGSRENDRWCSFAHGDELWAINLTRATNDAVRCDGTDPMCQRLTTQLYREEEDPTSFANPAFWGDLLIFHAEAKAKVSLHYRGGIFAWMPGWPGARKLTSSNGLKCQSADHTDKEWSRAIYCIDNATPSGEVDLLVTPDVVSTPLSLVTRLPPERPGVPAPLSGTASLAVSGEHLIYRSSGPGMRSLFRASTRPGPNAEKPVLIADDVKHWRLSVDGRAIYLLYPNGRLSWASLKDPSVKTDLALRVGFFEVKQSNAITDNGVAAITDLVSRGGNLKVFLDRNSAAEIDVGPSAELGFDLASDRRFVMFQPLWNMHDLGSVAIMNTTTREVCTLQPKLRGQVDGAGSFSDDSAWAGWMEYDGESSEPDLWIARTEGCTDHHMVGRKVVRWWFLDDRGLLFVDEWSQQKGGRLRYLKWGPGQAWPAEGPRTLFTSVDSFVIPRPGESLIPFTSTEPGQEGLYVLELLR